MIKINFHSVIDVITNSSTEIYTWQDGSVITCKEMINEFMKVYDISGTADDAFYIGVMCDEYSYAEASDYDDDECYPDISVEEIKTLIQQVLKGEIEKPEWMSKVENNEDYGGFTPTTSLYILPKSEKFEALGNAIKKFLNSSEHQASYNG